MTDGYDWAGFYRALCDRGPRLLEGIDDETREIVVLVAETDSFWSDGMESALAEGAGRGEMQSGVLAGVEVWRENVLTALADRHRSRPGCRDDRCREPADRRAGSGGHPDLRAGKRRPGR